MSNGDDDDDDDDDESTDIEKFMLQIGEEEGDESDRGPTRPVVVTREPIIIQGLFNPKGSASESDLVPLPPHNFALFAPLKVSRADGSTDKRFAIFSRPIDDEKGIHAIEPNDTLRESDTDLWILTVVPRRPADREGIADHHELWVDLDFNQFVAPAKVRAATDEGRDLRRKRPLHWLPYYDSRVKHGFGGHLEGPARFVDDFDGGFVVGGSLLSDFQDFGTVDEPWRYVVDHGFPRTRVSLVFFDIREKAENTVPPGLLIEVVRRNSEPAEKKVVMGAATIDREKKAAVITIALGRDDVREIDFRLPRRLGQAAIDHNSGRIVGEDSSLGSPASSRRLDQQYPLPTRWTSEGAECWFGDSLAPNRSRQVWPATIDPPGAEVRTVNFHLDDGVLTNVRNARIRIRGETVVTALDRRLAVRDPEPEGQPTKTRLKTNHLRAEDWFFVAGEELERTTLAIVRGNEVHALTGKRDRNGRHQFRQLEPIEDFKARQETAIGRSGLGRLYFLPDAMETDFPPGLDATLCHLLVYLPCRVSRLAGATSSVEQVVRNLTLSSYWWDQDHPGHAEGASPVPRPVSPFKDYWLAPREVARLDRVVKVRHLFGVVDTDPYLTVEIRPSTSPDDRAFYRESEQKIVMFAGDLDPSGDPQAPPAEQSDTQDFDTSDMVGFTLAHELGHALGLPDEYAEHLDVPGTGSGSFSRGSPPQVVQNHFDLIARTNIRKIVRPFMTDHNAMMRANRVQRLRYFWRYDQLLRDRTPQVLASKAPYVVTYPGFGRDADRVDLQYELPDVAALGAEVNGRGPWSPVAIGRLPDQRADVFVFRLGDDEGSRQRMFERALGNRPGTNSLDTPDFRFIPDAERLFGLVVLRSYLWFDFDDRDGDRGAIGEFWDSVYEAPMRPTFSLEVTGPANTLLPRVRCLYQPYFVFGPTPFESDLEPDREYMRNHLKSTPGVNAHDDPDIHPHLKIRIRSGSGASQFPTGSGPGSVTIARRDAGLVLARSALGLSTTRGGALIQDITSADEPVLRQKVARRIGELLRDGDPSQRQLKVIGVQFP